MIMMSAGDYFSAYLTEKIAANETHLPLCDAARADLVNILGDDGYTFLTIKDDVNIETVKVRNDHGVLLLERRGLEGTKAVAHPENSCVLSVQPTVMAAVKDLICNYDCCADDCPCDPVTTAFYSEKPATAKVGAQWAYAVSFNGTPPLQCGVSAVPSGITAKSTGNTIVFSGTPAKAGTYSIAVSATNCAGKVFTEIFTLTVT